LLIVVACFVGVEVKSLLVGQGVAPGVRQEMQQFLLQHAAIKRIFNLRTLQMGADVMVAIKAEMTEQHDAQKLISDINQIEAAFRQRFGQVSWCFFEPDHQD
jgi:divalent metal cation (Fe/Co/Zn/Cd) transporter